MIVVDWFLKYGADQALALRRAGADVSLVCREHLQEFDGNRSEWDSVLARLASGGVKTHVIAGRTRSVAAATSITSTLRSIAEWSPDLIHAHPSIDPWLHLVPRRRPLVLTVHDVVAHPGQPRHGLVKRWLSDGWRRRADAFIVHGQQLADDLRPTAGGRPIGVIPHGLQPAASPTPVPVAPSVLFFGRLEPYKGIPVLVEAMRAVWVRRPEVELVVAGQGPCADAVPNDPRIRRLIRYIPEQEVNGLLDAATLIVAPYLAASQSGVIALAVARGIPAVVTNRGSLPEVAVDPSLVVPAGDSSALANAIVEHLDHGSRLRAVVHEMARERLSWDATARLALDFYRVVLGR